MRYAQARPHLALTPEGRVVLVLIGDDVRHCTAFLYVEDRNHERVPKGTALFFADATEPTQEPFVYLVTARHVVEGIRRAHQRGLLAGSRIWVRVFSEWVELPESAFYGHPDDDEGTGDDWLRHRNDRLRIDIAAALFPDELSNPLAQHLVWPGWLRADRAVVESDYVHAGDEVAITGLYRNHVGTESNIPIVRSGIISAMVGEPVETKLGPSRVYLVEARSVGGLSGSPAFLIRGPHRLADTQPRRLQLRAVSVDLLGIVHGHFDSPDSDFWETPWGRERMNEGITMVSPIDDLFPVLHREEFMKKRKPTTVNDPQKSADAATLDELPDRPTIANAGALLGDLMQVPKSEADDIHRTHQE